MFFDDVKLSASGQWDVLLQQLAGLTKAETTPSKTGRPCPHCGGTDRYEFKSTETGFYMCRGCGAGDGWSMLQKRLGAGFRDCVQQVANYLRMGHHNPIKKEIRHTAREAQPNRNQQEKSSAKAQWIWEHSDPAPVDHPYLIRKRIPPYNLRQYKGALVSALYHPDSCHLVNLQFIDADGNKRFMRNGQTRGCYQWWGQWDKDGPKSWSIFVCEGVADAISTFLFYHQTRITIAAYSASNMASVGQHLRQQCPNHRLVLVLDNDIPTEKRKYRPGMVALLSHHNFDDIILPPEGCDASDMWLRHHE